jgi:hypothetical protein
MCTLSFVPKADGFLLAMNRDEQRSRASGLPPAVRRCGGLAAVYPSEPGGGTWVGINEAGLCAALINWYSRPQLRSAPAFSRGMIIPRLLSCSSLEEAERSLLSLPVSRLNPFRLILIGLPGDGVREYGSYESGVERVCHPWSSGHWFSSGHDEASASRVRSDVCRDAAKTSDAGTLSWLERLHATHDPEPGADSVCMHRDDAATVSLTVLEVSGDSASMSYYDGPPCESIRGTPHQVRLPFLR